MPYMTLARIGQVQREETACTQLITSKQYQAEIAEKMPSISDIALGGYAVVATGLTVLVMAFLDACNLVAVPPVGEHGGISKDECYAMSAAMMKAAPRGRETAGEILVMFFHVIVRIEQNFFLASAIAAWFALFKCSQSARKPFHLFLAVLSVCCAASDATFAGLPGLGSTGLELSDAAKASVVIPFIPLWSLLGVLNGLAFLGTKEKSA